MGVTLYQLAFTTALHDTLAANVAFLFDLSPLMTLAGQRILHMRRSAPQMFVGAGISLVGVLLLVGASTGGSVEGDGYALLAALLWAGFTLLTEKFHLPLSGIALTGWMSLFGTVAVIPFMNMKQLLPAGFGVWGPLAYTVVFVTIMGLSLWQNAVMAVGGGKASLYLYVIPVIAAGAGWLILGEAVSVLEAVGAVMIIVGVTIAEGLWRSRKLRGRPTQPSPLE
jgi:drug/metabolite transporter (DMT)-like permease